MYVYVVTGRVTALAFLRRNLETAWVFTNMDEVIFEPRTGFSCSKAGATEGLSYSDDMITPPPAACSAALSSELRSAAARETAIVLHAGSIKVSSTRGTALAAP